MVYGVMSVSNIVMRAGNDVYGSLQQTEEETQLYTATLKWYSGYTDHLRWIFFLVVHSFGSNLINDFDLFAHLDSLRRFARCQIEKLEIVFWEMRNNTKNPKSFFGSFCVLLCERNVFLTFPAVHVYCLCCVRLVMSWLMNVIILLV